MSKAFTTTQPSITSTALMLCLLLGCPVVLAETDPTRPKDLPVSADATHRVADTLPRLTSVLIARNRRLAVIDGHLIAQGQSAGGIRVKKITENRAVVRLKGRTEDLTLELNNPRMQKELRE